MRLSTDQVARWLYRAQHRLALTRRERDALATVLLIGLAGLTLQAWQQRQAPEPAGHAEAAAQFAAGAARLHAAAAAPAPTGQVTTLEDLPVSAAPARAASPGARLDLNTATAADFETLPRIGPALAARIVALRDQLGGFRSPDDLLRVRGIGAKTLDRLRPLVHAASPEPTTAAGE